MNSTSIIDTVLALKIEIILIVLALLSTIISAYVYISDKSATSSHNLTTNTYEASPDNFIYIDISGAVNKPDVYKLEPSLRLSEVIKRAGGLSEDADTSYISKSFKLSRQLKDQEKIYIPSKSDIENGLFTEEPQALSSGTEDEESSGTKMSINTATLEELDTLPGIGPVSAQKIIDARPISATEDLLSNKILKKNVYDAIQDFIEL